MYIKNTGLATGEWPQTQGGRDSSGKAPSRFGIFLFIIFFVTVDWLEI